MSALPMRPYQIAAYDAINAARLGGMRRKLVVMPTGTGKTRLFSEVTKTEVERKGRVLVLAHVEELIDQGVARLKGDNPGMVVGKEQASDRAGWQCQTVVASVQTIGKKGCTRLDWFKPTLVVCDEAHHAAADTYMNVFRRFGCFDDHGADLLGVTATPHRLDNKPLHGTETAIFEDVVYSYLIKDAVFDGWLCDIRAYRVRAGWTLDGVKKTAGDYNLKQLSDRVDNHDENIQAFKHWREVAADRKTIVFCIDVEHAEHMAKVFNTWDVPARAVSGKTPKDERRRTIDAFRRGEIQVLTNCLDTQTEILTAKGWKTIETIEKSDMCAAVNPQTGGLAWERILRITKRKRAEGERMVRVQNQTLDIRVTEGHRMLSRTRGAQSWRIETADHLPTKESAYQLRTAAVGNFKGVWLSDEELEFLGLFATDGSLNLKRASIEIAQVADSPMCAEIERILTGCGFDWKVSTAMQKTGKNAEAKLFKRYRVPKGTIGGQLARSGWGKLEGWLDKSLSPSLWQMKRPQFEKLLHGCWVGDGVKRSGRKGLSLEICGADFVMLDRLQAWAAVRGFSTTQSQFPNGQNLIGYVRFRDRTTVTTNNKSVPTSGGNPAKFEVGHRDETVWCVTNPMGTIITRRNGRVVVMGQCQIATEGFDVPDVGCVLLLRPTQSWSLFVQMVGRGLRLAEGKTDCIVIDVVGSGDNKSLTSVPEMFGLPKEADAKGQSMKESVKKFDELEDWQKQKLMARKFDLTAIDSVLRQIDLLAELKPPQEVASVSSFNWLPVTAESYMLTCGDSRAGGDLKRVATLWTDPLGRWFFRLSHSGGTRAEGGPYDIDLKEALRRADEVVNKTWPDARFLIAADAPWRSRTDLSDKQKYHLGRAGYSADDISRMTMGEASAALDRYFNAKRKAVGA